MNAPASDSAHVVLDAVVKRIGARTIIDGVSLSVARGEIVAIIGPSGSGKSSLLRLVNHLDSVSGGEITVAGQHVGYQRRGGRLVPMRNLARARAQARIGMVFQSFNLFEHMSALGNVMEAPLHVLGRPRTEVEADARRLLDRVGLSEHLDKLPFQLSGGQQQRVAIARALAIRPELLLLDEPTSALDPELVAEVLQVIREISVEGNTMLIVTHEIAFAADVADRVVFMDDGRIVEQGPARETIRAPRTARLRKFLSSLAWRGTEES